MVEPEYRSGDIARPHLIAYPKGIGELMMSIRDILTRSKHDLPHFARVGGLELRCFSASVNRLARLQLVLSRKHWPLCEHIMPFSIGVAHCSH